jgi:hypothetical protein
VLNVWLIAFIGLLVAIARPEETGAASLAGRAAAVVLVGAYLARLSRKPGWVPREGGSR